MTKPAKPATKPVLYVPDENDIVADMLAVVLELWPELPADKLQQAERQIRERWGGDRPYVAIRPGGGRSERNDSIRRDHRAGERIPLLERRYGLTRSQLHRILAAPEA